MEVLGFESRNVLYIFIEVFHMSPKVIDLQVRFSVRQRILLELVVNG